MASENETVAEIVKEIRDSWAQIYFSEGSRRKVRGDTLAEKGKTV